MPQCSCVSPWQCVCEAALSFPEPGPPPSGPGGPRTHVVLYQLVDGHFGLQQVVVESDNLVAQSSFFFVVMFALGQARAVVSPGLLCALGSPCDQVCGGAPKPRG